jgi:hypothetical protein
MTVILHRRSSDPGKIPTPDDLALGELAINTYDGKIYLKRDNGTEEIIDISAADSYELVTANFLAEPVTKYLVNTGSGSFVMELPATPQVGDWVAIADGGDFEANPLLVLRNGHTIDNVADDLAITIPGARVDFIFNGATWCVSFAIVGNSQTGGGGAPGVPGYAGSQGYTGSRGLIGFTGSQGTQGVTGFTGSQGPIGFTGSAGVDGAVGFTGSAGVDGAVGFTGSRGVAGVDGTNGVDGAIGFTGSQGGQGTVGFTGSAGTNGATGFTGSQGTQGVAGFTGSQGTTGNDGAIGFTGSRGATGFTGSQGTTGFTGSAGTNGGTGFTGSQGTQGTTGFTGSQGTQGVIGFTGSAGTNGGTGFTGSQGAGFTGSQGATGFTGSQGNAGSTGFTGSQGVGDVMSTGSYANPSWITSLAGSKITGNISGNAANITAFTVNQNVGSSDSPSFVNLTLTGVLTTVSTAVGMSSVQTGTYTLTASSPETQIVNPSISVITINLPAANAVPVGRAFNFVNINASNTYTLTAAGADLIQNGSAGASGTVSGGTGSRLMFRSDGVSKWYRTL